MSTETTIVLDHEKIALIIERFAHQIYEKHHREKKIILIGIADKGYQVAKRIEKHLTRISEQEIQLHRMTLDKLHPLEHPIQLDCEPASLSGQTIILIDDVLNSGKTLIHAVQHILQVVVRNVTTVVLVDRIHRQFPIKADIVGMSLSTTLQERVEVELGKKDYAYLV